MKTAIKHNPKSIPSTFDELNALHPLRPIHNEADFRVASEVMDCLAVLNRRTKDQNDYLGTLVLLTEAYEAEEADDALNRSKSSGLDALRYLVQSVGMKQTDLAKILKIGASAVSMVLSGERPITADHARKLGKHFELSPAAFL